MLKNQRYYQCKLVLTVFAISILTGCATPVTESTRISKREIRAERQAQKDLADKAQHKSIERKHKQLQPYQDRLNRVSAPLAEAAKKLNKKERAWRFKVVEQKGLNAWTDGKSVMFTPEIMDFLETDKELATVIAHELSHNVMGHHSKKAVNGILGTVLDIAAATQGINTGGLMGSIGVQSFSQGFENEADYVAIYILALAGYDVSNVHQLWRKMTIQTGTGTKSSFFSSHPSNPERFIRMQRAIEEVKAKQKAGQKLEPNYKSA